MAAVATQNGNAEPTTGTKEYTRLCPLATGGMATVDIVVRREGSFTRLYAMKRLLPHLRADPQVHAMFLDEARYAGLVRHTNVVSVLDVGEDADGPYLLMDYVEGVSLSTLLRAEIARGSKLSLQICLRIASQIAAGLHAAHELCDATGRALHLVHRDVSPQNILVGFDGVVRVTDFGIAKAAGQSTRTATGVLKGKLGYMSPEQLRFEEPDRRSDMFAVGVILYELLAGRQLYADRDDARGAKRILAEPPPDIGDERPDTPPAIVELLFELLAKEPHLRPKTAREISRRIEGALAELVVEEEGALDLVQYLDQHFGDERRARAAELSRLLETVGATAPALSVSVATAQPAPTRKWHEQGRTRLVAGAIAVVVLSIAVWRAGAKSPTVASAVPSAEPAPIPTVESAPADVRVSIETAPTSADVFLDGSLRGSTPLNLAVPRGARSMSLRITKADFADVDAELVPNVDQRFSFALTAKGPPSERAPVKRNPVSHKERGFKRFE